MRLTVLGSAGTYPVRGRPGSGYLIEHRETRIWCDAGPGTLTELPVPVSELDAVFVSHRHPDHCLDVVIASHVLAYGPDPRFGVPLYGPSSALEAIVGFVDGGRIDEVFDVTPLEDGDRVTIGSLILSVAVTDHSVDTLASRWETDHRSLCYSADTGPAGDWMRLAKDVDLFLCEATYQGEPGVAEYPHHLTASEAGSIARAAGAKQLMLTHIPPHLDPARSVMEAEATFDRPVGLAVPGVSTTL
ncbi:MAG TPA: MBL fold metallo-hydrolase [Acidimicrobiia bacterium]|nr:MBL fold metallo-hydrolase [Acidimicrobiia bacterium]